MQLFHGSHCQNASQHPKIGTNIKRPFANETIMFLKYLIHTRWVTGMHLVAYILSILAAHVWRLKYKEETRQEI